MSTVPVEFLGIGVSDDGERMTLVARDPAGVEIAWTLPSSSANQVMVSLIQASRQAAEKPGRDPTQRDVFGVEWWSVYPAGIGGVVLSFRAPGGIELSFHLPRDPALRFAETLALSLGLARTPEPGPRH